MTVNHSSLLPHHHSLMAVSLCPVWTSDLCKSEGGGTVHLRKITSETGRGTAASSAKDLCVSVMGGKCKLRSNSQKCKNWKRQPCYLSQSVVYSFGICATSGGWHPGPFSPFLESILSPHSLPSSLAPFWLSEHLRKQSRAGQVHPARSQAVGRRRKAEACFLPGS